MLTALVAVGAATVGLGQLREARRLRVEQAKPYVVCYAEEGHESDWSLYVVIKNFGNTLATDVSVQFDPELRRSPMTGGAYDVVHVPAIPALAPGQEWRTFWDTGVRRPQAKLPSRYTATVTFTHHVGRRPTIERIVSALDWSVQEGRMVATTKTTPTTAALERIAGAMDSFRYGQGGLGVFTRSMAAQARDEQQARDEIRERVAASGRGDLQLALVRSGDDLEQKRSRVEGLRRLLRQLLELLRESVRR
jgi:hypothetical protein